MVMTKDSPVKPRIPGNYLGRQVGQLPRLGGRAKKRLGVNPHEILEIFTFFLLLSSSSVRLKGRVHN